MKSESVPITITILDKEYRVSCAPDEKEALLASADYLNGKMKEMRDKGRVVGAERIAVIVALNLAHELLQVKTQQREQSSTMGNQVRYLQQKIDTALNRFRQLDL